MQNILNYFNSLLYYLFGSSILLHSPSDCISTISSFAEESPNLEYFIKNLFSYPDYFLSYFVWIWLSVLSVKLLLIYPFKWIRSIIRKCRLS